MKAPFFACLLVAALLAFAGVGLCGESGFSLGYGFAAFNQGKSTGKVEGGKSYNFVQATYVYEKPFSWKELALLVEPFGSYVANPATGADLGVGLGLKYYPFKASTNYGGLYLTGGSGMAYSTIGFQEQGTHLFSSSREASATVSGTSLSRTNSAPFRTQARRVPTGRSMRISCPWGRAFDSPESCNALCPDPGTCPAVSCCSPHFVFLAARLIPQNNDG